MYALVDANHFYCSAESVFRPDWRLRPLVCLSNNDGVVVAANRRALRLGIRKFRPYFEVRELCRRHDVVVCSSNYSLYADLSQRLMTTVGRFAPEQHVYSIDECFLRFGGCQSALPPLRSHALDLRRTVWKECRLPVCVGLGPTLTLAKAANHAAKRIPGFEDGVCLIDDDRLRRTILSRMRVGDVWGIGRRLTSRLESMGVDDAWQLSRFPAKLARRHFNVQVERTIEELNGTPCLSWETGIADKQQIYSTRSVGRRITALEELQQAIATHAAIAAAKLRQQGSLCGLFTLFASNSPHDPRPTGFSFQQAFEVPTDDTRVITGAASAGAARHFREGVRYYRIGIGLLSLSPRRYAQPDLFSQSRDNPKLMGVMDRINARFGRGTVHLAAEGDQPRWAMRRDFLTPQYTTRWREIPRIGCG